MHWGTVPGSLSSVFLSVLRRSKAGRSVRFRAKRTKTTPKQRRESDLDKE